VRSARWLQARVRESLSRLLVPLGEAGVGTTAM
jgi:hypothetical protein